MTSHIFDVEVATELGMAAAVILQNIEFWVEKNAANEKHFHDGRYWTYNSKTAFETLFPYLSYKQIRTALDRLREAGYLVTGNYNPDPFVKTLWYALGDSRLAQKGQHRLATEGRCIKEQIVNNTDSKQYTPIYTHADLPIEATQKAVGSERLYEHKKAGISIELPADVSHAQFDQFVTHRIELSKSVKTKKINQRVAQLGLTQMQKLIADGEDLTECLNVMEMKGWDQPYGVKKFNGGQQNAANQQVRRTGFAEPSRKFETIIPANAPEWLRD